MRRPVISPTFGMALGIALMRLSGTAFTLKNTAIFMTAVFLVCIFIIRFTDNRRTEEKKTVCLFFAFLMLGYQLCGMAGAELEEQAKALVQLSEIKGLVVDCEFKGERTSFEVETEQGRVLVNIYDEIEDYRSFTGCTAEFGGKVALPKERRNPHCFDYREHLASRGIAAVMTADKAILGEVRSPIRHRLSLWKAKFISQLEAEIGAEKAGLVAGLLFGEKGGIDDEIYEEFRRTGTAHILAVSGLHIGIVYAFAQSLLRGCRSRGARVFTAAFVILYAAVSGFAPSTVRAAGMILLHILSKELKMRYDMLCAACTLMMVNLAFQPLMLFNTGFQLSYLAIFTIAVILHRAGDRNPGQLTASVSIQLGLGPLMAYQFNYISFVTLIVNIPIIYLAGLMVPLAISMLYLSILPLDGIFSFAAVCLDTLTEIMLKCNEIAYMGGRSSQNCISPPVWALCLYYGGLFLGCSELGFITFTRKNRKRLVVIILIIIILSFALNCFFQSPADDAGMVFVDVGQGDCLHIKTPEHQNIMIDTGGSVYTDVGKQTLLPYLLKNGADHLDMMIITHLHMDHMNGGVTLCRLMDVERLGVFSGYSEEEVRATFPDFKGEIVWLSAGDELSFGKDVKLTVLSPEDKGLTYTSQSSDENGMSLVIRIDYCGLSAIMTADIDKAGEEHLIQTSGSQLDCDILKIAHHGSKYSSSAAFIRACSPSAAVIQVGRNNYGHPAQSVIETLQDFGIMIYRNDLCGAVIVYDIKNGKGSIAQTI